MQNYVQIHLSSERGHSFYQFLNGLMSSTQKKDIKNFILHQRNCAAHQTSRDLLRASLVAQWLRICLPMQGTRVQALIREDPTCHGAAKPVCHNY